MARMQQAQSNNLLSLNETASRLAISRRKLSSYVQTLNIQTQRGSDRQSYVAAQDVDRIQSYMEEKVNPAYQGLTLMSDVPMPRQMSRNVKAFVEEGFAMDNTFYKAVTYITQNAAAIPPKLYTDTTLQNEIKSHPLLDKLAKPNNEQDGVFYRESVLGWYLITGNAFQYAIRKGKSGPPDELWSLEVMKIHPLPSKTRGVTSYNFDDFPDSMNPIPAENIGHMRTWNPKDPIFGMSAVEPGAILLDEQLAARKWQLALLQNFAKPPGAWVFDGILDQNTRKKVKEALNLEMAGYRNAGKVPVLDGGFKWVSSMTPPSELDWLNSIKYNASQIADLFNIAPQLIGDTSATTYNNMEEAKAASYTEAIFPALDKLYSLWNMWLVPMYPDLKSAYLYYDKTSVEVVQTVIQARLSAATDRANKSWMQGSCTLNEAREQQGLPPLPGGDVFRFGAVLVRASELDKYAEQSLQTPAAPPMPVPENMLDTPGQPPSEPNEQDQPESEQKPKPGNQSANDESKALKWNKPDTEWVPADLEKRLDEYKAQGVTHLTWHLGARLHHCDDCKKNDGETVKLGEPFPSKALLPPQHPSCFPAGTIVSGPPVVGSTTRWYTGSLVEVETASGKFLSMTPNHPILTPHGWVAAGLLKEGDEVISCRTREGDFSSVYPDDYQVPSLIEDVVQTFCPSGEMSTRAMPGSTKDFHGDGINSEISIIRSYRFLRDRFNPSISQPALQEHFVSRNAKLSLFTGFCDLNTFIKTALHSTDGIMCGFGMQTSLFRALIACIQSIGFCYVPAFYTNRNQETFHCTSTDLESDSERLLRFARKVSLSNFFHGQRGVRALRFADLGVSQFKNFFLAAQQTSLAQNFFEMGSPDVIMLRNSFEPYAGEVFSDRILKCCSRMFNGHVYNLQTSNGWYIANGIITHNCDCEVEPATRKQQLIQVTRKSTKVVVPSVDERIADLQARGITHLQWVLGINCCHECMVNSGVTVKAGDPFPSGILLPPQCPDCQCTVIEHIQSEQKSFTVSTQRDKRRAREEYREFFTMEAK